MSLTGGSHLQMFSKLKRFLYQGSIPVTKAIMVLCGLFFLLYYVFQLLNYGYLTDLLILNPAAIFHAPWTLITYPLVNPAPLTLIFGLLWLWFIGGTLERTWGSWLYFSFSILVTILTGVAMSLVAYFFLGGDFRIFDLWLPLVAITWAWSGVYPDQEMLFFGIIPIKAQWLAWINAAFIFVQYMRVFWLMGFAAVCGILVVYLFRGKAVGYGLRYWAWNHGFSLSGWFQRKRHEAKKKRLKVIKH
jgi:membrane associated rhomboid family serine protease